LTLVAEHFGIDTVRQIDEKLNRLKDSEKSYTFLGRDVYEHREFSERTAQIIDEEVTRILNEAAERAALNAPIQGSAADIIKVAMIGVDAALREAGLSSRLLLQVHDELLLEVAPGERDAVEDLVRERMGGAYPLDVPLEVSVGYGPSWDAAAH
jgi:DNA polymerase I-like protein with 3'-5' exonuclease and polymerase domains